MSWGLAPVDLVPGDEGFDQPAGPAIVRDLYGTLVAASASRGLLMCPVGFTQGVHEFATGKPIELIHADYLVECVREITGSDTSTNVAG